MKKEAEQLYQYNHYRHLVHFHNFSLYVLFKKYIEELNKHDIFYMGEQNENDVTYIHIFYKMFMDFN